ncbi:TniQ family protein [Variovorax paradoxus]|uniref:TniQ family protein n=1 Tax=Variovorax paradoxus TaxID=34073 RepID=UPI003ECD1E7C
MSSLLVCSQAITLACGVEALASWVLRLAHNNGYRSVGALCTGERLGIKQKNAFDAAVSNEALEAIGGLVLADISSLPQLTLREPLTVLTGCAQGSGGLGAAVGRWLLKHPRESYGARYNFCCKCLAADEVPFLRRDWRLSLSCWCRSHECELTDACPICGTALVLSAGRRAGVSQCESCDCDFTMIAEAGVASGYPLAGAQFPKSGCLLQEAPPISVAFPHLWWDGVRILLELCSRPSLAAKLASADFSDSSKVTLHHIAAESRVDFDRQSTHVRAGLLRVVSELLENWPCRFIDVFSQAKLTRAHMATIELAAPFWLARVCDEQLNRKRYVTTKDEALAAIALLRRDATSVSKNSIKAALGIAESKALDAIVTAPQKSLTLSQLARVTRQIDRDILRTDKARDEQASALRDACCIAVAAWRGIGFERSARLALDSAADLACEWAAHSPSDTEQAFILGRFTEWFDLYLHGVRPHFARLVPEGTALFLTRFGLPYKGFGVAALFARALRACEIGDWSRGARLLVGSGLSDFLRQDEATREVLPPPMSSKTAGTRLPTDKPRGP